MIETPRTETPVLELKDIHKSYGALKAVNGVSLTVSRGEIHALIGPNGAGKTTLVKQVYGSEKPDMGAVFINGEDITDLSVPQRVDQGIGRSFQISNVLTDFSVLENAIIAEAARLKRSFHFIAPAFTDQRLIDGAMSILEPVALGAQANILASDLSHGERRLLELALAMAVNPALLMLDEPMAGTGTKEMSAITEMISGLRGRMAILLIEHDMDVVFRLADRITVMVEGKVIASGRPQEISGSMSVRKAYLGDKESFDAET